MRLKIKIFLDLNLQIEEVKKLKLKSEEVKYFVGEIRVNACGAIS